MKNQTKIPTRNIAIITLDSLRWDTYRLADIPKLDKFMKRHKVKWVKTYTHGTYTLPSHVALFQDGHLPSNELGNVPKEYKRNKRYRIFKVPLPWNEARTYEYLMPNAPNIVKGFQKYGYRTVGIGGVNWFSTNFKTSNLWEKYYFNEFYWDQTFSDHDKDAFTNQIKFMSTLNLNCNKQPLFFFLNIASTHPPCRGDNTLRGQVRALEYIDDHILKVFRELPKPLHVIMFSDHGTTFGEDGLRGHGFYHPKIIEVPMTSFIINN